ncbi:MAG: PQQ-binding-like beta-propeller repeat protein, partial [Pirellulales bacterium]
PTRKRGRICRFLAHASGYRPPVVLAVLGIVCGALATLSVTAAEQRADRPISTWPQFRGPGGRAVSDEQGLPTTWGPDENILWKTELPGAGTSSPIVLGDRIYLTAYSGYNDPGSEAANPADLKLHLISLARDGGIRWTRDIVPKLPEQERIREEHGYASSTPAADEAAVYASFGKTGVLAFDHDGKQLWHTTVGDKLHGWGSGTSPVLYQDLVIINAGVESESLVALDRKTGDEVWRAGGIRESWNTPILVATGNGETELVVAIMRKILGFNPATGKELWSCETNINWYMAPSMVAHEGVVYSVGGRSGGALAVRAGGRGDVTATHRLWTGRKGSNVTSPVYHDGHVYWMHENLGIAYCAKASSGEIVYEVRVPNCGQVYASPVLGDGKLYYFARDGKTYVLPAEPRFEVLAVNSLGERGTFNASPAIADRRVYLRSNRYLYCIGSTN